LTPLEAGWHRAVQEINAIGLGVEFAASRPFQRGADGGSSCRAVHGPDDLAWDLGETLLEQYAAHGIRPLIADSADEFNKSLDDGIFDLEPEDHFLTFFVFYITSGGGIKSRKVAPWFFLSFEIWLALTDPSLLYKLHEVRRICVAYLRGKT